MAPINDRMEVLFIYETKDCNPNGDPLDENKPRTDPETGVATVTDVRIKRTIRDYLHQVKGMEILVRDTFDNKGYLKDGKGRGESFYEIAGVSSDDSITVMVEKVQKAILDSCIDARLFGSTLPVEFGKKGSEKGSSIKLTGPVQFNGFNRSLHRVSPQLIQGTAGFASKKNTTQKSFREDHLVPYACIAVYGVINEIAARTTGLNEEDVSLLLEGLWRGTESLISRSKMGHQPLFLMRIRYSDGCRIGDLAGRIELKSEKDDTHIRSLKEYHIDVSELVDAVVAAKDKIQQIDLKQDTRLKFMDGAQRAQFSELSRLSNIEIGLLP